MWSTKFGVSATICFEVMLLTDTHTRTHRPTAKKCDFWIQNTLKHVNFYSENSTAKQYFFYHTSIKENKKFKR